jgi:hypothetical protein
MPNIAIIDDRKDLRETLKNLIEPLLPKSWGCIAIHPFVHLNEYLSLLHDSDKEIAAILLDEKLHEAASAKKENVFYSGTELARFIRKHLPEFPIYLITSFPNEIKADTEELFEGFFAREAFQKQSNIHLKRMVRAGGRFSRAFQQELSELSAKASLLASGRATKKDCARIDAIRGKLEISFPLEEMDSRSTRLTELEMAISKLQKLSSNIKGVLKSSKRAKR